MEILALGARARGSAWNVKGKAVEGALDGEFLTRISHFDVMCFAWSALYPDTDII